MTPKSIHRSGPTSISIDWSDGHRSLHTLSVLRRYCPCASCKTEGEHRESSPLLPVLTPGMNELSTIVPVGSYALQFIWKDGHQTGIYTYEYLRQLCECEQCRNLTGE